MISTISRAFVTTLSMAMLATACANAQVPPPGPAGPGAAPPFGPPPAPPAGQTAAAGYGSLVQAYRDISNAGQFGGEANYLQSARSHYAQALARFRRGDRTGARGQARAASDLAEAAIDSRPLTRASGLATPPAATSVRAPSRSAVASADLADVSARMTQLSYFTGLENTAETRTLAGGARAALSRAQTFASAARYNQSRRQANLARDLSNAVRHLAYADHPNQVGIGPQPQGILRQRRGQPNASGAVGPPRGPRGRGPRGRGPRGAPPPPAGPPPPGGPAPGAVPPPTGAPPPPAL